MISDKIQSTHEMNKETLNPDEVHLWFVFPEEIQTPDLLSAYQQLLSIDEKVRKQRLRYERLRRQYLISRAFVRTTLSRYCTTHPAEWSFYKNKHGRPEIIPRRDAPELRFNLSHTRGLISCGVALREDIGVDVEEIFQRKILLEIAQKHFSAREVDDLSNLLPHQQKDRFFDYWTLKESYIKARGRGLSLPLNRFCFQLSPSQSLSIFFDPSLRENSKDWQFWLLKPTPQHKASVAIHRQINFRYSLVIRKIVPLSISQPMACPILQQSWN